MISSEPNDASAQALRAMAKRVIVPLVRRHAADAAFYWSQHDASNSVPGRELSSLARFSNLLAAHLEGVEVASVGALVARHAKEPHFTGRSSTGR